MRSSTLMKQASTIVTITSMATAKLGKDFTLSNPVNVLKGSVGLQHYAKEGCSHRWQMFVPVTATCSRCGYSSVFFLNCKGEMLLSLIMLVFITLRQLMRWWQRLDVSYGIFPPILQTWTRSSIGGLYSKTGCGSGGTNLIAFTTVLMPHLNIVPTCLRSAISVRIL